MGIMDLFNQISSGQSNTGPVEYIIVGLGNPGTQYQDTRHNAGFMAIDTMAEKFGADVKRIKFKSLCGECTIAGKKCLLMKPSTYMNNSGEAVVEAMNLSMMTYRLNRQSSGSDARAATADTTVSRALFILPEKTHFRGSSWV